MSGQILFYIFSSIAILSALMVITARNPIRAVLSLVLSFIAMSCVWMLLQVEFLALVLIVVYVGAVMVLFLFVVMMLDIETATLKAGFVKYWPLALIIGGAVAALIIWVAATHFGLSQIAAPNDLPADYSSISNLGNALYSDYLYPFELAAVLLLAAMIAAITLTFRGSQRGAKSQDPAKQAAVNPKERLKIVKMHSEMPLKDENK